MSISFWGFRKRLKLILQTESAECALACLAMVSSYHGHEVDLASLRRRFHISARGVTLAEVVNVAEQLGLEPRAIRTELPHLAHIETPCILHWDLNHFVVLGSCRRGRVEIFDPGRGHYWMAIDEASEHFTGVILEVRPGHRFTRSDDRKSVSLRDLAGGVTGLGPAALQILGIALGVESLALALPFQMQWVLDQVLVGGDVSLLATSTACFVFLLVVQMGLSVCRSWIVSWLGASVSAQWTTNLFAHLLRLPTAFFEKRHIGDIVSRFSSIQAIQSTLTGSFVDACLSGLMGTAALVIMLAYSASMALLVVAATAAYAGLRWAAYGTLWRVNEEQLVYTARQQTELMESVRGAQIIQLAGVHASRKARLGNATVEMAHRSMRAQRIAAAFAALSQGIFGTQRIVLMAMGAWLVLRSNFSAGMLIAFVAYADQFSSKVSTLIDKVVEFRMLGLHAQRVADIALAEPDEYQHPTDTRQQGALAIDVDGLGYRYSEAEPWVFRGVSFCIKAGESVAIVGPSGCGKTTLAKILVGLAKPNEGEILLRGHSESSNDARQFRQSFGIVMQDDALFAGSIADNIAFFDADARFENVVEAAKFASIHDDIAGMPMGYETLVGDMGSSLSGGQRQRIILARALYRKPGILLLDEATSHLDTLNEQRINSAISAMNMTRIIIAHRKETIASADRVIDLGKTTKDGKSTRPPRAEVA